VRCARDGRSPPHSVLVVNHGGADSPRVNRHSRTA
jgi:hypothetical protein